MSAAHKILSTKCFRVSALLPAFLWLIVASPYLSSAVFFSHGHHRLSLESSGGELELVFHHEGEQSHSHKSGEDHVSSLSALFATAPSTNGVLVTKYQLVNPFLVFVSALPFCSWLFIPESFSQLIEVGLSSGAMRRTVVLMI